MSISRKITGDASGGSGGSGKYVDDVFSTYLYEGTGADRDIVNDIDLDDKGGLVWLKNRSVSASHYLFDTERGENRRIYSDRANSEVLGSNTLNSFNDDGFSLGAGDVTTAGDWVSWTFAKQEGFFDVVTWTGDNVVGRAVPHNLGSTPGMVIIKCVSHSSSWLVWHKDLLNYEYYLALDTTASQVNTNKGFTALPTDSELNLTAFVGVNSLNREYVAYVFADDAPMFGPDGDESIIKCGSYTGNGSNDGPEIDLGWEPQWILIKGSSSGAAYDWRLFDAMRGIPAGSGDNVLQPNKSDSEETNQNNVDLTATGFRLTNGGLATNKAGETYIYMAIRRPNKPAEEFEPEELFAVDGSTTDLGHSSPAFRNSGFQPGMAWYRDVSQNVQAQLSAPLIQGNRLDTTANAAATTSGFFNFDYPAGWGNGFAAANNYSWMFRRAPGFFDVVTYTGGQGTDAQIPHNLGARPEMLWVKSLSDASEWCVWSESYENTDQMLILNRADALSTSYFGSMPEVMTDEVFQIGGNAVYMNGAGKNYIAYLWASVPGICDIGSYTGTGADLNVDCGFTNGARFILIKRTDSSGDWLYFDTLRGVTNSDSPRLRLNAIDAQNSGSYVKPLASGFTATSNLTGIDGAEYIYMAIA
jgi:hypothetical protein